MSLPTPIVRYFNPRLELTMVGVVVRFENGRGLQVNFNIERSLSTTPDACHISVINLDPVRALAMGATFQALGAAQLQLRAGYDAVLVGVFAGDVRTFVSQRRLGSDVATEVEADDGGGTYTDAIIRPAISNVGQTAEQSIQIAATYMGLIVSPQATQVIAATEPGKAGPYTAVATGKASELMDAACRRIGCRWYVRDAQLFLLRLGAPDSSRPAVLVTDRSLVGDVATGGSGEVSMPVMFDPNIVPGGQVSYRTTAFRVERVVHSGSTRGTLWVSRVEGRAL